MQQCFLALVKLWEMSVEIETLFTHLPIEFDCVSHKLLIVKLHACGLD